MDLPEFARPTLVFDRARIEANMRGVAEAARKHGISVLFAAKSFPHRDVRALAAQLLDGFDVASVPELVDVDQGKIISVADPTGAAIGIATGKRVIASCETPQQVMHAPKGAEIAIRISASVTGTDPAVGAVLQGTGYRRSRFGLDDRESIAAVAKAAAGRRIGLHVHHGPITAANAKRFIVSYQAARELVDLEPAFVDLGGAWQGIDDLPAAFAEIREAIPRSIEILIEPGRMFSDEAGFASGHVLAARTLADRELRVCDLSRVCHLKWSQVELVTKPPHPDNLLLVGPTCYEEDVLGEYFARAPKVGERVILRNVSGYAVAWNMSFGGVPAADVIVR